MAKDKPAKVAKTNPDRLRITVDLTPLPLPAEDVALIANSVDTVVRGLLIAMGHDATGGAISVNGATTEVLNSVWQEIHQDDEWE